MVGFPCWIAWTRQHSRFSFVFGHERLSGVVSSGRVAIMAITDVFDTAKSRKSYKYSALPDAGGREGAKAESVAWKDGERRRSLKKLGAVSFLIAAPLFFVIWYL